MYPRTFCFVLLGSAKGERRGDVRVRSKIDTHSALPIRGFLTVLSFFFFASTSSSSILDRFSISRFCSIPICQSLGDHREETSIRRATQTDIDTKGVMMCWKLTRHFSFHVVQGALCILPTRWDKSLCDRSQHHHCV